MQALRTWLRLLRGPQVPREDAHRSVCLSLNTVRFRVFTGCVAIPQPYSRAFSSHPKGTPHLPPCPAPSSHRQRPACGLASSGRFLSEEPGDLLPLVAGFPSLAGAQGSCVDLCPPPVTLWPSPSPMCGQSTSCLSTHHCWTAELLPLFGYQTCGRKFSLLFVSALNKAQALFKAWA